jgi:PPM family protein phosphatase
MKPIFITAAGNPENQDRGIIIHDGPRLVLCIADGAGGRSGGAEAAAMAVEFIRKNATLADSAGSCSELLHRMDAAIANDPAAGETTCALVVLTLGEIFGASVGDSGAWLIQGGGAHLNLTVAQQRKPFIGSGDALPVPFERPRQDGLLLLATDGLLKYTSAELIAETCLQHAPEESARRLIELVRYPSGALPDDVTVIIAKL